MGVAVADRLVGLMIFLFPPNVMCRVSLTQGKLFAVFLRNAWLTAKATFVDVCLPCATHGKEFAMCIWVFSVCL